jgi:DNA repair exonuclease SbcCD nuclease subunit
MSKLLIFSDLHCHPHKRSTERLNDCIKCLDWVFKTAVDRNIKNILFLGDLFHDRQKIDVLTYQKTFEVFERYLTSNEDIPFEVWLLLGNHDLWHLKKWDISSVNPLRTLPGVHVIDKTCTLLIDGVPISFLPYTDDPTGGVKYLLGDRKKYWPVDAEKILCGHVAIDGAIWNVMHNTFSEVSVEHDGDMMKVFLKAGIMYF